MPNVDVLQSIAPWGGLELSHDPHGSRVRIQIVKGWVGSDGETYERVYDVAPAGCQVDAHRAATGFGAPEVATVWTDPDFDPEQIALYYARMVELPIFE